jgi:hypothetical protein
LPELNEDWLTDPERRLRAQMIAAPVYDDVFVLNPGPGTRDPAPGSRLQREPGHLREPPREPPSPLIGLGIPNRPSQRPAATRENNATRWNLQEVEWPSFRNTEEVDVDGVDGIEADDLDDASIISTVDDASISSTIGTNDDDYDYDEDSEQSEEEDDEVQPTTAVTRSGRTVGRRKKRPIETCTAYRKAGFPGRNLPRTLLARSQQKIRALDLEQQYVHEKLDWSQAINSMQSGTLGAYWAEMECNTDPTYNTVEEWNPSIISVKANANNNPNWGQAISGPHSEGYWQACIKEYETLIRMEVWEEADRES